MEHFFSGLISGTITAILCSPLDTLKTRSQIKMKNNSFKTVSLRETYRGISANLIANPIFWSFYFGTYNHMLKTTDSSMTSSFVASSIGSFVSSPFWVARTCMQTGSKGNVFSVLKELKASRGFLSWFSGYPITVVYNTQLVIMMPLYSHLKEKTKTLPSTMSIVFASSVSKIISGIIVYPFDTIRSIVRTEGNYPKRFIEYYRGISIYMLRSVPFSISIFLNYEITYNFIK